jgi:steroid Delta-isomerase
MPSQEAITQTVNRYLELVAKGTADDVLTLYAADATVEDPIGSDLRRDHDAIREFYAGFPGRQEVDRTRLTAGRRQRGGLLVAPHARRG